MFGDESFGVFPFGDASTIQLDASAFLAFLARPAAERCWLLELDAFSLASSAARSSAFGDAAFGDLGFGDADAGVSGGVQTQRYSSHGYTDRQIGTVESLSLPGVYGNYAETPDSPAVSITGDIDIRIRLAMTDWTPAGVQVLLMKSATNNNSFRTFISTNGRPRFDYSVDGVNFVILNATAAPSVADGAALGIRISVDVNDGAGNHVVKFWTSTDFGPANPGTWTQLGSTVTNAGTISLFDGTAPLRLGDRDNPLAGKVYYAELRNGIDGPVVARFDPAGDADPGDTSFTSSQTGEVWTIFSSGSPGASLVVANDTGTHYESRVQDSIRIERRIVGRGGIGGLARSSASVALANADGGLDTLPRDYALDGRRARLLLGAPTDRRSDFGAVFGGYVMAARVGLSALQLDLSDSIARLEIPVHASTYAGTGGLEGGADLQGTPKPRGFGHVYNIAPPLVDAANLIYQVNDGPISDVPAVYDRGVPLTKVAGTPAAGQYQVDTAAGTFKLGATPAGTVTCDALLDASGAGYVDKTGDIVLRLLGIAGLTSDEIDPTSFVNLNSVAPAEVGIWTGTEVRTIAELVDELLAGVGAFGGFNRRGAFAVQLVSTANRASAATYDESQILDIEEEPLPAGLEPTVWRVAVGWRRAWTVQSDLAASVSAAQRSFAARAVRVSAREDASIRSRYLLARAYEMLDSLYAQQADADAERDRLFALWSGQRRYFRVRVGAEGLARELGDIVTLKHRRFGLAEGRDGRVLAQRIAGAWADLWVLV